MTPVEDFNKAKKGAILSIAAYTLISIFKIVVGKIAKSEALSADGFNNFTDIVSSFTVLIGLWLAEKPADRNHRYGHWKLENLASLVTSIIMFIVGSGVLFSSISRFIKGTSTSPDLLAAIIGLVSAVVMLVVYFINRNLAKSAHSLALKATAKDNRNDALTSIFTAIAIFAATFKMSWVDGVTAIIVGLMIIKTAFGIFKESAFYLSDGFDDKDLDDYIVAINDIKGVGGIKSIKGRSSGSNIYLDLIIAIDPQMSVRQSHAITEQIKKMLQEKFNVYDVDVHVEPDE